MRSQLKSASIRSTRALQRLFALQEYSLARYAAQAQLYGGDGAHESRAAINDIAKDQSIHASSIGNLLASRREPMEHHSFPLCFTGLNYVSADYVARLLLTRQPQLIAEVNSCMAALSGDAEGRRLAREVLAGETANLNTLRSIASDTEIEASELAVAA
jgi:hypothetical protein